MGTTGLGEKDQKLSFGYDTLEMPIKFHRHDIKWAMRYVILKFRGEFQGRIIMVEDIISQTT